MEPTTSAASGALDPEGGQNGNGMAGCSVALEARHSRCHTTWVHPHLEHSPALTAHSQRSTQTQPHKEPPNTPRHTHWALRA